MAIAGLQVIQPPVYKDHRGTYICTYRADTYDLRDLEGRKLTFIEDDVAMSTKGVLRGLHGDAKTWKLMSNLRGEIFFVVIDMRAHSPTYRMVQTFTLGDSNPAQVLVPAGCANGHLCLTDFCVFTYKQTEIYHGPQVQFTVAWNDPLFNIPWPIKNPILSPRDAAAPFIKE